MPTSYTSLLGLALPVTGELAGTWGTTANDYITQYLDAAVAGAQTISGSQTAVTLTTTNGSTLVQAGSSATGSAQYQIINCTGNPASLLTITVPAQSKAYLILNATSTSQSVKVVGAGPTTGVTMVSGEKALIAWDGSDFVKVATSTADGVTTLSFGTTGLTPNSATAGAITVAGTLVAANGGTGQSSYTTGDLLYATGSTALSKLGIGTNGQILTSTGTAPQWTAPAALTKTDDTNVTLTLGGSASTALLNAASLTLGWTGQLGISRGGTNATATPTAGAVAYGTGTAYAFTAAGTSNQVLISNGASAPSWSNLSSLGVTSFSAGTTGFTPSTATSGAVTLAGTLATTNGGTGLTSFTANRVFYASSTSAIAQSANLTFDGTTLTAAGFSGPLNGTVGATTPNTGSFTTLTTSSTVTHNGGTANGVAYLDGSKVLTTGSALTFDGTLLRSSTYLGLSTNTTPDTSTGDAIFYKSSSGATLSGFQVVLETGSAGSRATRYTVDNTGQAIWSIGGSEQMRLTSTGLKVGTTSDFSSAKVVTDGGGIGILNKGLLRSSTNGVLQISADPNNAYASSQISFDIDGSTLATLDSSGNLGLGVQPSAWTTNFSVRAFQFGGGSVYSYNNDRVLVGQNTAITGGGSDTYINSAAASTYRQFQGAHAWYTAPSGTAGNAISFSQVMTLDASGRLAIANTSPTTLLSIGSGAGSGGYGGGVYLNRGASAYNFYEASDGTNTIIFGLDNTITNAKVGTVNSYPVGFYTNNTERARITSGGDLLVGTTDSSASSGSGIKSLPANNGTNNPQFAIVTSASTNTTASLSLYSTGAAAYRFYVADGGTVYATSTTISGISDQRFKENIQDLDVGLAKIMALKPRKFDWKAGKGKDIKGDRGFIAQEFEQVFPDLIDEWKDPAPEGEAPYKSVRADLIPVLVKAIQELKSELDTVKAELATLKGI